MKERVISSIVALIICIPLLILGGIWFLIGISILGILGLKEIFNLEKNDVPNLIKLISYGALVLNILGGNLFLSFEKTLCISILLIFLPIIFYPKKTYNFESAIKILAPVIFLGLSLNLFGKIRLEDISLFIFVLLVPILYDIFAFLVGHYFGKIYFIPKISPKKSLEGCLAGAIVSMIGSSIFYIFEVDPSANIFKVLIGVFFLAVMGQLGDLFFSAIKRYYGVKDFSNIMPGHGGILDRIDSTIFVILSFMVFYY